MCHHHRRRHHHPCTSFSFFFTALHRTISGQQALKLIHLQSTPLKSVLLIPDVSLSYDQTTYHLKQKFYGRDDKF